MLDAAPADARKLLGIRLKGRYIDADLAQVLVGGRTGDGAYPLSFQGIEARDARRVALLHDDRRAVPPRGTREGHGLQSIRRDMNIRRDHVDALGQHGRNQLSERHIQFHT